MIENEVYNIGKRKIVFLGTRKSLMSNRTDLVFTAPFKDEKNEEIVAMGEIFIPEENILLNGKEIEIKKGNYVYTSYHHNHPFCAKGVSFPFGFDFEFPRLKRIYDKAIGGISQ